MARTVVSSLSAAAFLVIACLLLAGGAAAAGCGGPCSVRGDCANSSCATCSLGACTSPYCGSPCDNDDQCEATDCNTCIRGSCAASPGGCGFPCETNAHCGQGCYVCANGTDARGRLLKICQYPSQGGCNLECDTHDWCNNFAECTYCSGGTCNVYLQGVTKGPAPGTPAYEAVVREQRALVAAGKLRGADGKFVEKAAGASRRP